VKTVFQDEVMLAGWKETHTGGATVTFFLPDASLLDVFRGMTVKKGSVAGQRLACVLAEIQDDESIAEEKTTTAPAQRPGTDEGGKLAQRMHLDGYWFNQKLWLAMHDSGFYTLQEHKAWIETQPCAVHGQGGPLHAKGLIECVGQCCAHHADQAGDMAGGSRQPENPQKGLHFLAVPTCFTGHAWAHNKDCSRESKQWMRTEAIRLTANRLRDKMKEMLGLKSMRQLTPELKVAFEEEIGLIGMAG